MAVSGSVSHLVSQNTRPINALPSKEFVLCYHPDGESVLRKEGALAMHAGFFLFLFSFVFNKNELKPEERNHQKL